MALLAVLHFGGAPDAAVPDVLKVHRLELVDGNGKATIAMNAADASRVATIAMYGTGTKPQVILCTSTNEAAGGTLSIQTGKGTHGVTLSSNAEANITLNGPTADDVIRLSGGEEKPGPSDAGILLRAADGGDRVRVSGFAEGGQIMLDGTSDDSRKMRITTVGPVPTVDAEDWPKKKTLWTVPTTQP